MLTIELEQAKHSRTKPHGAFVIFQQRIRGVFQIAQSRRVEFKFSQLVRLAIQYAYIAERAIDYPKHAETVFVEPKPDAGLACENAPLNFPRYAIKFVKRLAGANPKRARSVFARGLDVIIPEARGVIRVVKVALHLARDRIQAE